MTKDKIKDEAIQEEFDQDDSEVVERKVAKNIKASEKDNDIIHKKIRLLEIIVVILVFIVIFLIVKDIFESSGFRQMYCSPYGMYRFYR